MWYNFRRLLLFILPLLFVLFVIDVVVSIGLRKSEYGNIRDWNNIAKSKVDYDVLINGSSKAWVQVSPLIIDSVLSCNSYNLGLDGADFYQQYFKYKFYRSYHKLPKIIIQIVGNRMLERTTLINNIYQYLPYINNSYVRNLVCNYHNLRWIDCLFPLLRYSKRFDLLKIGFGEFLGLNIDYKHDNKYKGFKAQYKSWNSDFEMFKKKYPFGKQVLIDTNYVNMFDSVIKYWKLQRIKVVLVVPPSYFESNNYILNRDSIINIYQRISRKYDCLFFDYSNSSISNNKSFFYNSQHLNSRGANVFSRKLAEDIKKEKLID